jgi:hypothetical protein
MFFCKLSCCFSDRKSVTDASPSADKELTRMPSLQQQTARPEGIFLNGNICPTRCS